MIGRSYTVQLFHPFFPRLESRESGGAQAAWWGSDDKRRAASPTRQSFGAVSARQCTTSVPRARTRVLHVSISCPLVTRDHHSSISTRVTIVLARKDWRIPFPRGFRREWASHAEERKREVDRRLAPRRFLGCTVFTSYVTATRGGWQTRWSSVSTFFFFSFRMCARESCGFESVFEMLLQDVIGKRDCFWFRYFYRRVSKDCITFCHRNT